MKISIKICNKVFRALIVLTMTTSAVLLIGCSNTEVPKDPPKEIQEQKVIFKKFYDINDEEIQNLKEDTQSRGKKVDLNTEIEGNLVLVIETEGEIKDININEIDQDKFAEVDFDINLYLEKYKDLNCKSIDGVVVNKDSSLIVRVQEPETIPMYYITFKDELDNMGYYLVSYNGRELVNDEVEINKK